MKFSLPCFLMAAVVLLTSTSLSAQAPARKPQALRTKHKADLELQRERLRVNLADMQFKIAFVKYTTGTCPVSDVLDAASEALRKGLEVGGGGYSCAYEKRIKRLEAVATQNLERRTGTQGELELVRAARLDALLKSLLQNDAEPNRE